MGTNENKNMNESAPATPGLVTIPGGGTGGITITGGNGGGSISIPPPFAQDILLIEHTRVAGTTHVDDIDEMVAKLHVDDKLKLQREKDNMVDKYAILILSNGKKLGYVSADCNEILARLMDAGKALFAKLTQMERVGHWHKLSIEIYMSD